MRMTATTRIAIGTAGGTNKMTVAGIVPVSRDEMTATGTATRFIGAPGTMATAGGTEGMAIEERTGYDMTNGTGGATGTVIETRRGIVEVINIESSV
jgi:hypothetical protein